MQDIQREKSDEELQHYPGEWGENMWVGWVDFERQNKKFSDVKCFILKIHKWMIYLILSYMFKVKIWEIMTTIWVLIYWDIAEFNLAVQHISQSIFEFDKNSKKMFILDGYTNYII